MPHKQTHIISSQQLELPFGLPELVNNIQAIDLCAGVFQNHSWNYNLEKNPDKITSTFTLPHAGTTLTGIFPDDKDASIMVFACSPETIPEYLKPKVASMVSDFTVLPGVNAKIFADGFVRLITQLWLPKTRTLPEVDHILSPTLDCVLHQADVIFPKLTKLLTMHSRHLPTNDNLGLSF
jgi:hypothetical protein